MTTTPTNNPIPGPVRDSEPLSGSAGVGTPESDSQAVTDASRPVPREQRYRIERNEARAERDALAQRVERMQRSEVERVAAEGLSNPADLFSLSGNDLADYLTDDGDVDTEKVSADVEAILQERPGLRKHSPALDPSQGSGGSAGKRSPSFADLFH